MKRDVDWFSLILGISFMALALLFLADQTGRIRLDLTLIGPLLLIAFGTGAVCNGFRKPDDTHDDRSR